VPRRRTVEDDAVLAAAMDLVGRVGPAGVTLAAVAGEVGLAPATLVQRFGSKRGLLLAAATRAAERSGDAFAAARAGEPSPLAALRAALCRLASAVGTPEAMANNLAFLQIDLRDPDFHRLAAAHAEAFTAGVRGLLDEAVAAGELPPTDTVRLAEAVQTTYNGALVTWAVLRRGPVDEWLLRQLDVVLAAPAATRPGTGV
jgi:AcrR family transcriptional regulator